MSMTVQFLRRSVIGRLAAIVLAILVVASVTLVTSASAASPEETDTTVVASTTTTSTSAPEDEAVVDDPPGTSQAAETTESSPPPKKPDPPADEPAHTTPVDAPEDTQDESNDDSADTIVDEPDNNVVQAPEQQLNQNSVETQNAVETTTTTEAEEAFSVSISMSQQGYGPGTQVTVVLSGNLDPTWRLNVFSVNDPSGSGAATPSSQVGYGPPLVAGQSYTISVPVAATDTSENSLWYVDAEVLNASSNTVDASRYFVILPDNAPVDTDNDGVPDTEDQCPNDPGPASNNGCPIIIPLPADPTFTDPPGPNNTTWDPQTNDDQYTWEETPDGHLIVRPTQPGHAFPGNEPSHDYGKAPDSYVPPTIIPLPPAPSITDPPGPNNATWDKPENDDQYTWTIEEIDGRDHLIVRPTQPKTLLEGSEEKHDYGPAKDSYECPPGTQPIYPEGDHVLACKPIQTTTPAVPTTTPVVTTNSPSSSVAPPPVTTSVATPPSVPSSTNTAPPSKVIIDDPARPGVIDPPGPGNAQWEPQTDTDQLYWVQSDDKRCIVAHARDGSVFAGGAKVDFGCAPDSEGEQVAVESSTRVGNPTPQPTGNGGDGIRASAGGGEIMRLVGVGLALSLALIGGFVVMGRRKGAHENA